MTKKIKIIDIKKWIESIKLDGITKFRYSELPNKFKNEITKRYMRKANLYGFIKKLTFDEKIHNNEWEINDKNNNPPKLNCKWKNLTKECYECKFNVNKENEICSYNGLKIRLFSSKKIYSKCTIKNKIK